MTQVLQISRGPSTNVHTDSYLSRELLQISKLLPDIYQLYYAYWFCVNY